jgi:hypothetical protein
VNQPQFGAIRLHQPIKAKYQECETPPSGRFGFFDENSRDLPIYCNGVASYVVKDANP